MGNNKFDNPHYVARLLSKDWSVSGTKGGKLKYYDFSNNKFGEEFGKNLFSQKKAFSVKAEKFLRKKIENPLGDFKNNLFKKYKEGSIPNWNTYRGMILYFATQASRLVTVKGFNTHFDVEYFAKQKSVYLDQLASAFMADYVLYTLYSPEGHCLFLPETGYFINPIIGSDNPIDYGSSYCVPLIPTVAMVLAPKLAPKEDVFFSRNHMMEHSVGLSKLADKILIPTMCSAIMNDPEIESFLLKCRNKTLRTFQLLAQKNALFNEMLSKIKI